MADNYERESGYEGVLVSLGGVVSLTGRGRITRSFESNITSTIKQMVLPSNPKRISAVIENIDNGTGISLYISFTGTGLTVALAPNGSFQIDSNFPWTGPVWAQPASVGTCYCGGLEVSVF